MAYKLRALKQGKYFFVLLFLLFSGCGDFLDSGSDSDSPDKTAPSVVSTIPQNNQKGVSVNQVLSVTFDESPKTFTFILKNEKGIEIPGTTSQNGSTVSFTPSKKLAYNTYTATCSAADASGNSRGTIYSFSTVPVEPITYHKTPDSNISDVGNPNSIFLFNGKAYISYYNITQKSLYIIATVDGAAFDGPHRIDGPTDAESVGEFSSLAVDGAGRLHVAYYREGIGLKHAYADKSNISAGWTIETVDMNAGVGKYNSIDVDGDGHAHISYYDEANTALKYANNISGWQTSILDDGYPGENPGLYTSLKVDKDNVVHISYYDSVTGDLKYINSKDGATTADSTGNAGEFSSLSLDSSGRVYIAYNHVSALDNKRRVRVITDASGVWRHSDILEVSGPTSCPIFIDSNNIAHLSYYTVDPSSQKHFLYHISGVLLDAVNSVWDWPSARVVDNSGIGDGIAVSIAAGVILDSSGNTVKDSTGTPVIKPRFAYYDKTEGDLKFAQ